MGLNMAERIAISDEEAKARRQEHQNRPYRAIGKIHRREVVEEHGDKGGRPLTVRQVFEELLTPDGRLKRNSKNLPSIDSIADLFVNEVKEVQGWFEAARSIAKSLGQNPDEEMRQLGHAIRHHAEQVWAARHVDDSKRSG